MLKGEALARAYANLDLFVFPSETDTFGNVVLEAQAAAVPAAVSAQGGPKFIIEEEVTGFVAPSAEEFARAALALMHNPDRQQAMREAARACACAASWPSVFAVVLTAYRACTELAPTANTTARSERRPLHSVARSTEY